MTIRKNWIGRMRALWLAPALVAFSLPNMAGADSVSVAPTRLTVQQPSQQTTLTVKAGGRGTSVLQVRVMEWDERKGPDALKPTRKVVVSPPIAKLKPRQELTVRIVRTNKRRVQGRECYRVLVDRLPGSEQKGQAIKLQVRHSVPLCFTS